MKTVPAHKLSNRAMVSGNEAYYRIVIDDGIVKEWVGIGWIELRKASKSDIGKYPTVERKS